MPTRSLRGLVPRTTHRNDAPHIMRQKRILKCDAVVSAYLSASRLSARSRTRDVLEIASRTVLFRDPFGAA